MNEMTATYDPADNKLRLRSATRLPKDLYDRVKAHGFKWAPKQELFVAPMWTPEREDLLIELCGEVDDEDTSLVDRAAQRAERFEEYSIKRGSDANSAKDAVSAIAENIPFGQPILVGHHSERRARKDAERIENGMRKAVKMWECSQYWADRAESAIAHAKYKERPDVRARRIKVIEADKRKQERYIANAEHCLRFWQGKCSLTDRETGQKIPIAITEENRVVIWRALGADQEANLRYFAGKNGDCNYTAWDILCPEGEGRYENAPEMTVADLQKKAEQRYNSTLNHCQRWIAHYDNRLAYEKAMLAADGGTAADKFNICVGGQVLRRGHWFVVTKCNRIGGALNSVTVIGHFAATIPVDEIKDYRPPQDGDWDKVKAFTKQPPLCNYPGKSVSVSRLRYEPDKNPAVSCVPITQAQWDAKPNDYKGTRIVDATAEYGRHRVRYGMFGTQEARYCPVYITDAKLKLPPKPEPDEVKPALPEVHRDSDVVLEWKPREKTAEEQEVDKMRDALKNGVKVVSAPQLFPTPGHLAARMVALADIQPVSTVLEPSAGTGSILKAIDDGCADIRDIVSVTAVEINPQLSSSLRDGFKKVTVHQRDFLAWNGDLGKFDRILMNPPFERGSDIKHIKHAAEMLAEGGRLVAICANGPKQKEELQPLASHWENLPEGTFKEQGTNVNTALLVIEK